jgi:hypothetical protein
MGFYFYTLVVYIPISWMGEVGLLILIAVLF